MHEALSAAREAEQVDREFWGYENTKVTDDMFWVAESLRRAGEPIEAISLFQRVLELRVAEFGTTHEKTLEVLVHLIWIELQNESSSDLVELVKQASDLYAVEHPAGTFMKALNMKSFLQPYLKSGRQQEAQAITHRLEASLREAKGEAHFEMAQAFSDSSAAMKESSESEHSLAAWRLQSLANRFEKQQSQQEFAPQAVPKSTPELKISHGDSAPAQTSGPPTSLPHSPSAQALSGLHGNRQPARSTFGSDFQVPRLVESKGDDSASIKQIELHQRSSLAMSNDKVAVIMAECAKVLDVEANTRFHSSALNIELEALTRKIDDSIGSGLYDLAFEHLAIALLKSRKLQDLDSEGQTLRKMAKLFLQFDQADAALKAAFLAAEADRAYWGEENAYYADDEMIMAEALRQKGDYELSQKVLDRVMPLSEQLHGRNHNETFNVFLEQILLDLHENNQEKLCADLKRAAAIQQSIGSIRTLAESLNLRKVFKLLEQKHSKEEIDSISQKLVAAFINAFGISHPETLSVQAVAPSESKPKPKTKTKSVELSGTSTLGGAAAAGIFSDDSHYSSHSPAALVDAGSSGINLIEGEASDHESEVIQLKRKAITPEDIDSGDEVAGFDVPRLSSAAAQALHGRPGTPEFRVQNLLKLAGQPGSWSDFGRTMVLRGVGLGTLSGSLYAFTGHSAFVVDALFCGFVCCVFVSMAYVCQQAWSRQQYFRRYFPDAISNMVSIVEAGTPLMEAFQTMADTLPPMMAAQFQRALEQMREGTPPSEAVSQMRQYMNVPQLEVLAAILRSNRAAGVSVVQQLRALNQDLRNREREKAPASRQSPLMIGIALVIVLRILVGFARLCFYPPYGSLVFPFLGLKFLAPITIAACAMIFMHERSCPSNQSIPNLLNKLIYFLSLSTNTTGSKIRNEFSTFMDLVVGMVKAGQSVPASFYQIAQDASGSCPTLCGELKSRLQNMTSFKNSVPNALREIGEKYHVEELINVASTLQASAKLGGDVSYQLEQQSQALKSHLHFQRAAKAARSTSMGLMIAVALLILKEIVRGLTGGFHH